MVTEFGISLPQDAGEEPEAPEGWRAARVARYGRNVFTFFERE